VYQERLYCIRWVDPKTGNRSYRAPNSADLAREARVLELLLERFAIWQAAGYIPSREIEPGYNTNQPIRERGWTRWHQLFNPRQLLTMGLGQHVRDDLHLAKTESIGILLSISRMANFNSKLCVWDPSTQVGKLTFMNQALNTLANFPCRSWSRSAGILVNDAPVVSAPSTGPAQVQLLDSRKFVAEADLFVTDPGYGDSVNYDEISEFFWHGAARLSRPPFPDGIPILVER